MFIADGFKAQVISPAVGLESDHVAWIKVQSGRRADELRPLAHDMGIDQQAVGDALRLAPIHDHGEGSFADARAFPLQPFRFQCRLPVIAIAIDGVQLDRAWQFGFLRPDEGGDDLFLSPRQMRAVLHGDRAVVRVRGVDRRGRKEGALVEVIERNTHETVGRLFSERGVHFVIPDDKKISQDILISDSDLGEAVSGQVVVVTIVEQPTKRNRPIGRVSEVLGDHMAPGMEIEMALRSHELPFEWTGEVEREAKSLDPTVDVGQTGRQDLRKIPFVTIDGEDARDFDDAVYCTRTENGWRLLVAIADVSHYVMPDSSLDQEAVKRGTSVYFPEQVIPMLPEILSNGLCSLVPDEDRFCMVCEMLVSDDGRVYRSRFFDAVMRSQARMTYTEVAGILASSSEDQKGKHKALVPHVRVLYDLYKALRVQREARGAMDFDTQESVIVFGKQRKIEKIVPLVRNEAHRLIEECMLVANCAAARFLEKKKMSRLLRVHEGPSSEKVSDLRVFLEALGLSLGGGESPAPADYMKLTGQISERADRHVIQTVLLRSLSQAVYTTEAKGHFGLALESYTHFTSPIRRYPDLVTHRAIRHCIQGKKPESFRYSQSDLAMVAEHCSMAERRADDATRNVVRWLKCEYMMDKIGEQFDGVIDVFHRPDVELALTNCLNNFLAQNNIFRIGQRDDHTLIAGKALIGTNAIKSFDLVRNAPDWLCLPELVH